MPTKSKEASKPNEAQAPLPLRFRMPSEYEAALGSLTSLQKSILKSAQLSYNSRAIGYIQVAYFAVEAARLEVIRDDQSRRLGQHIGTLDAEKDALLLARMAADLAASARADFAKEGKQRDKNEGGSQ